jgi:cholesterol transport system auxiliary component
MTTVSLRWLPAVLLTTMLVTGCTLVPTQQAVDRAWFLLEVPESARAEGLAAFVELGSVRVAPAIAGKGLVYRLGPYRYESDFYNEWFLSPREHVEQILRERWTREDAPVTLVTDAQLVPGAQRLDLLVTALHGDLEGEGPGSARIGLRVFVQGPARSRLWELERQVDMPARSPEALVAALSSGMAALLEELEHRLRE